MEVQSLKQLLAWQPPQVEPLISHGILLPTTRLVIYGQPKSWKSMLAQHTAFCLAAGKDWLGFKVANPVPVLLVQIEIPRFMFQGRVRKYANGHSLYPDGLYFSTEYYLKLDRDFGYDVLARSIDVIQPQVLIVDPLYKVLSGNISDSYDMLKFLDNMDRLRERFNLSIIVIHHTHQTRLTDSGELIDRGLEEMMGSSYIPNWLDAAIEMRVVGKDLIQVSPLGMRHAEEELPPFKVVIDRRTLGFRRQGLFGAGGPPQ